MVIDTYNAALGWLRQEDFDSSFISVVVIKDTLTKSSLGEKRFIRLTIVDYSPSLWGSQDRN